MRETNRQRDTKGDRHRRDDDDDDDDDATLLHKNINSSTSQLLFDKSVPDDKHSKTQYHKAIYK